MIWLVGQSTKPVVYLLAVLLNSIIAAYRITLTKFCLRSTVDDEVELYVSVK